MAAAPAILPVDVDGIPAELKALNRWVLWRIVTRDGKSTKLPFQCDGSNAESDNPETWSTFDEVMATYNRGGFSGVGVMLGDGLSGIDLDGCRNPETGEIDDWAMEHILAFHTYAEISPTSTGIKLLLWGKFPTDKTGAKTGKHNQPHGTGHGGKTPGIECYHRGRYFAITGRRLEESPVDVVRFNGEADNWFRKVFTPKPPPANHSTNAIPNDSTDRRKLVERAIAYLAKLPEAVSGDRGSDRAYHAACICRCDFGLSFDESMQALLDWNGRCIPPWTEAELQRKLDEVARREPVTLRLANAERPEWQHDGGDRYHRSANEEQSAASQPPPPWPDPKPLPSGIPAVMEFDVKLLPSSFVGWLQDVAERTQAPIDFSAVAAMVALSAVVGRKVGIRPKRHDDWTAIANLWGFCCGRPGVMKSQAVDEAFRPVRRLEIEAGERFDHQIKEFEAQELIATARRKAAEKQIAKAVTDGDPLRAREIAEKAVHDEPTPPARRRYLLADCTVEKLGEILQANPNGVAVLRDELMGLLKSLDKEGMESARAFLLEAWNGNGRFVFDRVARGTVVIEAICVSLFGGIQPGPLGDYQRKATRDGAEADGLLQRFQLAVYPDISKDWRNVDRWPDTNAKSLAYSVFTTIDAMSAEDFGATTDPNDPEGVPFLRFDSAAQDMFDAWRGELERRLRGDSEHPTIASHLGKYRSLIPSLALLIHLAEGPEFPTVGVAALEKAIAWGRYLESHARRIFAVSVGSDVEGAKSLADKIGEGLVKSGFTAREIYRSRWVGLTTKEDAEEAIGLLVDLDWLRECRQKNPSGGHSKITYEINPMVKSIGSQVDANPPS